MTRLTAKRAIESIRITAELQVGELARGRTRRVPDRTTPPLPCQRYAMRGTAAGSGQNRGSNPG